MWAGAFGRRDLMCVVWVEVQFQFNAGGQVWWVCFGQWLDCRAMRFWGMDLVHYREIQMWKKVHVGVVWVGTAPRYALLGNCT